MTAATILVIRDFNIQIKGWRPVLESNPWRRRERNAIDCNSIELRGMDSTLPHLKDSGEHILDAQWTLVTVAVDLL